MELLDSERSVLLVIDLQGKLMEMVHRPTMVIESTKRLMQLAELFGVPVMLTEQYPKGLGTTHPQIRERFDALEVPTRFQEKTSFGCCGDPDFERLLGELRPSVGSAQRQIVVAGIEAHICVTQTVLELLRQQSQVFVCWEAVSCRGEEYRRHALERLAQAGAVITNHESVGFEWARHKDHPAFKSMSALFKQGQIV